MKKKTPILDESELRAEYERSPEGQKKIADLEMTIQEIVKNLPKRSVTIPSDKDYVRFIMYGDTQLGSYYERIDVIAAVYQYAKEKGIDKVLHTGDVFDGHKVYNGQEFEVHKHGWDQQKKHGLKVFPKVAGVNTYFITGNHDASLTKLAGVNVGEEWSQARPDWHYLGQDYGRITFQTPSGETLNVDMIHPDGGTAYAISYRSQRIIEQMEGGTKPHILGIGHFHKAELLPQYRNICAIQTACCQNQTPFMKRKPTAAHVGFWDVEVFLGKRKQLFNSFKFCYNAFY
jgi:hypothetical protein